MEKRSKRSEDLNQKKKTSQSSSINQPTSSKFVYFSLFSLAALLLFNIFLAITVFNLEKKVNSSFGGQGQAKTEDQSQNVSPLSVKNLKKYAKELKLDLRRFNRCLDSGEKVREVKEEFDYGSSLGVRGTPGFFINGRFLGGAFPIEFFKEIIDKELEGTATNNCLDYSENLRRICQDKNNQAFNPEPKAIDLKKGQRRGPEMAPVTIVEFSDFECSFCLRSYDTVKEILRTYGDKVRFYYFHYPLNYHPNAQKAAEASLCAGDQGKFWEYHDRLFEVQKQKAKSL
ncbi:MAG: thioredoxin domain-containing protein [Patescibacteria group bacterium]|nr:thioredoxin domain-containing protein [Patescibacteria group bacterium]